MDLELQGFKSEMLKIKERLELLEFEVRMLTNIRQQTMFNSREQALNRYKVAYEMQHGYTPNNDSAEDEID